MSTKFRIILLLVTALVASGACYLYSTRVSPEVVFWANSLEKRIHWSPTLENSKRRVIFTGGSSCAFSVRPDVLEEEFGLASINMGLSAGAGRALQLDSAYSQLQPGDVLVLHFETSDWGLNDSNFGTALGAKLWHSKIREMCKGDSLADELGYHGNYQMSEIRPGMRHIVTMGLKLVAGRPKFRYGLEDVQQGGFLATDFGKEELFAMTRVRSGYLSPARVEFLQKLKEYLEEREITLAVTLAWEFVSPDIAAEQMKENRALVEALEEVCLVFSDDTWGVITSEEMFSDSKWHLAADGAAVRTRELGRDLIRFMHDTAAQSE